MFESSLVHDITYWEAVPDTYGGFSYTGPIHIKGRWEQTAEMFATPDGEETVSKAVVFVDRDVKIGDFLYLGLSYDTTPPEDAERIRQFASWPDLVGVTQLRAAYL